jgi:hypothetical protein
MAWNRDIPVTEQTDWPLYMALSGEHHAFALCKSDDTARDFMDAFEDEYHVEDATMWRIFSVPRMVAPPPDYTMIGFIVKREDENGRKMPWDHFDRKLRKINDVLKRYQLPDVMDDWKTWHEGAVFRGDETTVLAIENALSEVEEIGMKVYSQFPEQFYMDKVLNVEKYL